jgi:magnesium and cobalt exporter, CNNM family
VNETFRIVFVLLLILGNALFVAAEYALVTARRTRLQEAAEAGSRTAGVALGLMDDPVRFISTVQVGITALAIATGAIGEPLVSGFFEPFVPSGLAFAISFLLLSYLSVAFGELVPKAIALQKAEPLARALALPIDWFARLVHPIIWLLEQTANAVTRLVGVEPAPAGMTVHSEEDIRRIVGATDEIEAAEQEMLYKVFDFADKEAHDVMVPRPEVVAISVDLPAEECLAAVIDSPFTRYPAYRGSLDEIVGVLHVRDLFSKLYANGIDNVAIEPLLRKPFMVPETKDLGALLSEFRVQNQHMAIVVDEYGAMQGIVTLEDLLEEIVGEIEDEYDLPDESVQRIDDNRIRIDGTFPIDDFNERFQQEIPLEDYHTVAGFVFGQLGRAPEEGDEVVWDGLRFGVIETEGARIEQLEVEFLPETEPV